MLGNVFRLNYLTRFQDFSNSKTYLFIEGMTCDHCVDTVTKALNKISGVSVENINLSSGKINYLNSNADINEIYKAIKDLGYKIKK